MKTEVIPGVFGAFGTVIKEEGGRKHQEGIRESYCDRDSRDLHAEICTNRQEGAYCMNKTDRLE